MALNIINRTNQIGQTAVNSQTNHGAEGVIRGGNNSVISVNARDLGLNTGQTLSGQIVDVNGNEIKLMLDNNQTINAKLEGNLSAVLGQTISFEVSKTEGGQASLRPLYTNLSNSTAILDALNGAGLPNNEQNLRMVSTMMDEGMPVNKNALWDMSKQVNSFPFANPETIVKLTKLSLPITELNINQFENYENFEHRVRDDVNNLSKGIVDLMDEALKEANPDVYSEAINITGNENGGVTQKTGGLFSTFLNVVSGNKESSDILLGKDIIANGEESKEIVDEENAKEGNISSEEVLENSANELKNNTSQFNTNGLKTALDVMNMLDMNSDALNKTVSSNLAKILGVISERFERSEETSEEGGLTDEASVSESEENEVNVLNNKSFEISTDGMTFKEALDITKNLITSVLDNGQNISDDKKQMLSKFLTAHEFKENIKEGLSKQLFLKPEQFTGNEKVEDLYSKIVKQANQALELLNNSSKDNPDISKAAQNLTDNVNFMNELNQALTYVQIPLLMNNQSAHGDLYVYTNKKSLKEKDGNLTALLHLDMDNLGPMDIHIALNNGTKVKTNFILQDEDTIDFIAKHIDQLNDRLTKKGYDMSTSVTSKVKGEGETNIVDEFMKETPESKPVTKVKYSFDVRA